MEVGAERKIRPGEDEAAWNEDRERNEQGRREFRELEHIPLRPPGTLPCPESCPDLR